MLPSAENRLWYCEGSLYVQLGVRYYLPVMSPENPMRSPLVTEMPIALVIAATVRAEGHLDRAVDELRDAAESATK